mmetsp:Transcript_42310/g.92166  ORF Transcript_42310/g.92166 Transcript_42310/m.92166 type:complete len:182 (+) Transcript_42310:80-625(+)
MARLEPLLLIIVATGAAGALRARSAGSSILPDDTSCYMPADKGLSYKGLVTSTVSGRTCQKWTETHPWDATTMQGEGLGNHNYCRNPDGSQDEPWCFTLDPVVEKEPCSVPACPEKERDFTGEADELKMEIGATDCECAEQLYGSTETTKDTSVPLAMVLTGRSKNGKPCNCRPHAVRPRK